MPYHCHFLFQYNSTTDTHTTIWIQTTIQQGTQYRTEPIVMHTSGGTSDNHATTPNLFLSQTYLLFINYKKISYQATNQYILDD